MEIRVFVRKIPKNCAKNEFVDAIKRKTKGSRRVLYVCKPDYVYGYGLVWYSSLESALEAQRNVLTIKGTPVELLLYDDPRNPEGPVVEVSNRLSQSLYIDGEWVKKSELAYSQGLQQGVSGVKYPKWCKFTESEIDCPQGELCNFIHLQRFQRTKNPDKRKNLHALRKIDVTEAIYTDSNKVIYESQKIMLPIFNSEAFETTKCLSERILPELLSVYGSQKVISDKLSIDLQTLDLVELILDSESLAAELASKMDKAVEREAGIRPHEHVGNAYAEVIAQCPLNHRMNASFSTIVDHLHSIACESSIEQNIERFSKYPIVRNKWQNEGITINKGRPRFELEYFVTVSYNLDEEHTKCNVDLIFPVYDFVFLKKVVLKHYELHSAIMGFIEKEGGNVVKAAHQNRNVQHGKITLHIGYGFSSTVSLLGIYEDGPEIDDHFFKKLQEQTWKTVFRLSGKAPLVLITDYPPVKAMQSAAPQSWISFMKNHCEYR
ncbi:hypothetical protein XU18_1933 [Perkinsela sp. CCAP 1560/4]|nr:hypothetical protein XU18_1933 [Perkinsela sp. CCAP 1560/4]|eukprot:KNH07401.1 hypothetical protein XU18_1933 [Perkinsela sp. CCAP 1560/4]